jgi:hypothetical protein
VSFAAEFGLDVEGVGAIEVDVVVLGGCQVRRVFVGDGVAVGAQGTQSVAEVGVPVRMLSSGPNRGLVSAGEADDDALAWDVCRLMSMT